MIAYAKRIGFSVSKRKIFSQVVQSAVTRSQSFRGYHNPSLLLSPQVSLTVAPFLGAPGSDQSPLLPVGVGSTWGLAAGCYFILCPFLVSWSIPSISPVGVRLSRESERWSKKRTCNTVRWHAPLFVSGFLRCSPAESPVQCSKGPVWLESSWGLQKCCRNQYSRNQAPHSELENSG